MEADDDGGLADAQGGADPGGAADAAGFRRAAIAAAVGGARPQFPSSGAPLASPVLGNSPGEKNAMVSDRPTGVIIPHERPSASAACIPKECLDQALIRLFKSMRD